MWLSRRFFDAHNESWVFLCLEMYCPNPTGCQVNQLLGPKRRVWLSWILYSILFNFIQLYSTLSYHSLGDSYDKGSQTSATHFKKTILTHLILIHFSEKNYLTQSSRNSFFELGGSGLRPLNALTLPNSVTSALSIRTLVISYKCHTYRQRKFQPSVDNWKKCALQDVVESPPFFLNPMQTNTTWESRCWRGLIIPGLKLSRFGVGIKSFDNTTPTIIETRFKVGFGEVWQSFFFLQKQSSTAIVPG